MKRLLLLILCVLAIVFAMPLFTVGKESQYHGKDGYSDGAEPVGDGNTFDEK